MELTQRVRITPFLRIFLPILCGILAAPLVGVSLWVVIIILIAVYTASWFLRGERYGSWYVAASLFFTGIVIALIASSRFNVPQGERLYVTAGITAPPYTKGRWQRTEAVVGYYRQPGNTGDTTWTASGEKIQLYVDTTHTITIGDKITARGYLNPIDTTGGSYSRLMRSRGMASRMFVVPGGLMASVNPSWGSLRKAVTAVNDWMTGRIDRLEMETQNREMVKALVAGETRGIGSELKDAYANAGVIHVMSVSGLHMGFVLIIVNLLLCWMVFLPRGHIANNCVVIICLWFYALAAGLSLSVVRAAFMASAVQLAFATSARSSGYNILFAAATVMLAVNPSFLYDISFQLSFLAVLSIMFFFPRLYRRKLSRSRAVDFVLSSLLLSVAAQLGTMPLVAYNFGRLPMLSIIINPVVVVTAFAIIALALLWVLLPLAPLGPVLGRIISWIVDLQNLLVEKAAMLPGASAENITLSATTTLLLYLLLLLFMAGVKLWESRRSAKSVIFTP